MTKKRLDEIDLARGIAILGVLTVHGTSTAAINVPNDSITYPFYHILHTLGKLGTPTFIMLSSFILFYVYFKRDLNKTLVGNFYKKRLKFILVPYLVISLFYFLIKWKVFGLHSFETIGEAWDRLQYYLLFGKAHAHLYFVFLSVQFYLLFPFLLWAMKKSNLLRKFAVPIGIIIQLSWLYLNNVYEIIPREFSIIFAYAAFYLLGAYLGIHYDQIKAKFAEAPFKGTAVIGVITFFCGFFGFAFVAYDYFLYSNLLSTATQYLPQSLGPYLYRLLWLAYTFFVTMVVLSLAVLINKYGKRMKRFLLDIGALSFGIYLIHPFYLMVLRPLFETEPIGIFHIYQFIILALTFILSIATVYLAYRFLPFSWVIFGKKAR